MEYNFFDNGIRAIKEITLPAEEKQVVLSRLMAYASEHPARNHGSRISFFSDAGRNLLGHVVRLRPAYAFASVIILFLAAGGGVTFAAERALPGDLLYPIKIYVDEPVRGALMRGEVQKAQWEATKAVRRLQEAESLATQGRLSTTTIQTIKVHFEKSADTFNTMIQKSEEEGRSEEMEKTHADFDSEIDTHAWILSTMAGTTTPQDNDEHLQEERQEEQREKEEEQEDDSDDDKEDRRSGSSSLVLPVPVPATSTEPVPVSSGENEERDSEDEEDFRVSPSTVTSSESRGSSDDSVSTTTRRTRGDEDRRNRGSSEEDEDDEEDDEDD